MNEWTRAIHLSLGHEVKEWTFETLPHDVQSLVVTSGEHLPPAQRIRHASNVVRWWALSVLGGHWADADLIPLRPFDSLPSPATANHNSTRCTSWLAFPADHPVPRTALRAIVNNTAPHVTSATLSGEQMLGEICPDNIPRIELPIDSAGKIRNADVWAIHLFSHRNGAMT